MLKPTPEILVLDFDRTLGEVARCMDRLFVVAKQFGLDAEAIREAQAKTQADGGSFEPLSLVRTMLGDDAHYDAFMRQYKKLPGHPVLYEDAARFLLTLESAHIPNTVATYGVSREWQEAKLIASGYKGTYDILKTPDKAALIRSWQNEAGLFEFRDSETSGWIAVSVCLIDDKASAFANLPEGVRGYLVQRDRQQLESQRGEVSERVERINSLAQLAVVNGRVALETPPLEL